MELIEKPIVCQQEENIPKEVKRLRSYIRSYMALQKVWSVFLALLLVALIAVCSSPVFLFTYGKILEAIIGVIVILLFPIMIYVFIRAFAPKQIENYYKEALVLKQIEPSERTIGNFTYSEIHNLLEQIAYKMGFIIPPGAFIYDKHKEEANAFYTNLVDHHTKIEKIVLHENILFIVNAAELQAVIAHELGHVIQPWPFIYRSKRYSQTCEHLSDYNALVYAGLIPTINALIKIYARKDYLMAVWEKAQEILIEKGFEIESIDELSERAKTEIPQREIGDCEGESEADRLTRLVEMRASPDKLTRWQKIKQGLNLRKVRKLRCWRKRWKLHLAKQFSQFYNDRHIDENEFRILVSQLQKEKQSDLFTPPLPKEQRKSTHPMLRERLLFLARCANITET